MKFNDYVELEQYSLSKEEKEKYFLNLFNDLNEYHLTNSKEYNKILSSETSKLEELIKKELDNF